MLLYAIYKADILDVMVFLNVYEIFAAES